MAPTLQPSSWTHCGADKIVVLKDGIVAEEGSHGELLALGGVYAELHRIQYDTSGALPANAA
jgi:ABC-type multidrug transport system fused ATPase/permease subunit